LDFGVSVPRAPGTALLLILFVLVFMLPTVVASFTLQVALSHVRARSRLLHKVKPVRGPYIPEVGDEPTPEQFGDLPTSPAPGQAEAVLVEAIAKMIEFQPLMSDLTPAMGTIEYHQALASKIRTRFSWVPSPADLKDTPRTQVMTEAYRSWAEREVGTSSSPPSDIDDDDSYGDPVPPGPPRRLGALMTVSYSPDELDVLHTLCPSGSLIEYIKSASLRGVEVHPVKKSVTAPSAPSSAQ
jgi:hypothetical protein